MRRLGYLQTSNRAPLKMGTKPAGTTGEGPSHAANRLAPKFLQIENLSSRGKIILWRDKIPPDEKKSTALGDVPDSGNLCRNHAPNFLWRKVTDPLWRGCMPSGRSSTKTRFLQVNVDLLYL